jgi:hypothetical protein
MPLKKDKRKKVAKKSKKSCVGNNCAKLIPKERSIVNSRNFGTILQQSSGNTNDTLLNMVNMLNRGNETKFNDINQNFGLLNQNLRTNQTDLTDRLTANQTDLTNRLNTSQAEIRGRLNINQTALTDRLTANQTDLTDILTANHTELLRTNADEGARMRNEYATRSNQFINRMNKIDKTNEDNFTLIQPVLHRQTYAQGRPTENKQTLQKVLTDNAEAVLKSRLFKTGVMTGEALMSGVSMIGNALSKEAPF